MQENTLPNFKANAIEGTLLTRDYLAASKRANDMAFQAQIHAKKIINEAWRQSEEIKENAFQDRFESGLVYCIEIIVAHFKAIEKEYVTMQRVLQKEIIAVLTETFEDNSIFLNTVAEWYKKDCPDGASAVVISLPKQHKKLAKQLCSNLRGLLLTEPQVIFHDYHFYQVKSGDRLMVFNAADFTAGMVNRLVMNNEDIGLRIKNVSNESLCKIQGLFNN